MLPYSTASRPALGPTQFSIQRVPRALPLGIKRPGREAQHSPKSTAEFKTGGALLPLPHTSSWHGDQIIKHGANLP
jgi:hypothetical protein